MAGERLPARFSLHSQLCFRGTGKCFETATSHMQTVGVNLKMGFRPLTYLLLLVLCSCQPNYDGIYSTCWETPEKEGCEYIVLNSDGTFLYSNPYYVSGNIETKGHWKRNLDTLFLNTNHKFYDLVYSNEPDLTMSPDSVLLAFTAVDAVGKPINIGAYAEVSLGLKAELFKPDSSGILKVNRKDLTSILVKTIGVSHFWVKDISTDRQFNHLEIQYFTEFMDQQVFHNEIWFIRDDSVLIPTFDRDRRFLDYRILKKRKKN